MTFLSPVFKLFKFSKKIIFILKTLFRLTEKPHSLKPLSILVEYDNDGHECYSHPYSFEIDNFRMNELQLSKRDPKRPQMAARPLSETPCVMVNSLEKLNTMIKELSGFTEIGVDLEAHSYRTYLGITCLIQVRLFLSRNVIGIKSSILAMLDSPSIIILGICHLVFLLI